MKHLLSGVAAAALISVAATAWAQAPMSPSTATSPPAAPAPADAAPAPATAVPAAPPAAATTAPPAAAAPPPVAEAAPPRRPKRVSKPAVTAHRGAYSPRGMSDNIANQLNAQELNRVEGPPAMSPPGLGYAPPPPMAGGPMYGPPGYAPPPPWGYRPPPPYGVPPPWGYRPY